MSHVLDVVERTRIALALAVNDAERHQILREAMADVGFTPTEIDAAISVLKEHPTCSPAAAPHMTPRPTVPDERGEHLREVSP